MPKLVGRSVPTVPVEPGPRRRLFGHEPAFLAPERAAIRCPLLYGPGALRGEARRHRPVVPSCRARAPGSLICSSWRAIVRRASSPAREARRISDPARECIAGSSARSLSDSACSRSVGVRAREAAAGPGVRSHAEDPRDSPDRGSLSRLHRVVLEEPRSLRRHRASECDGLSVRQTCLDLRDGGAVPWQWPALARARLSCAARNSAPKSSRRRTRSPSFSSSLLRSRRRAINGIADLIRVSRPCSTRSFRISSRSRSAIGKRFTVGSVSLLPFLDGQLLSLELLLGILQFGQGLVDPRVLGSRFEEIIEALLKRLLCLAQTCQPGTGGEEQLAQGSLAGANFLSGLRQVARD